MFFFWALSACGGNFSTQKFHRGVGVLQGKCVLSDGSPLVDGKVEVVNLPSLQARTNAAGEFELKGVPAGRRELLILHHDQGLRRNVWVVGGKTLSLPRMKLEPTSVISGKVSARHRFGARGIKVTLKGTRWFVFTHNQRGEFRFERIPAGCHLLEFSTPFFRSLKSEEICVMSAKSVHLARDYILEPERRCGVAQVCPVGGFCRLGVCVPDGGGAVAREQQFDFHLGTFFLQQVGRKDLNVLTNRGPGRLHIRRVTLVQSGQRFRLELPFLPSVLEKGQVLTLGVKFLAEEIGFHQAILKVETSDPEVPSLRRALRVEVRGYSSNCLVVAKNELNLGRLFLGRSAHFQVSVFNRCGVAQRIEIPRAEQGWLPPETGFTPLQLQALVPPGRSVSLDFSLQPKFYGSLYGKIQLHTGNVILRVSFKAEVVGPKGLKLLVEVGPKPLEFGMVAPGETRTLWLRIRFGVRPSFHALKAFRARILSPNTQAEVFRSPMGLEARSTSADNREYYLPVKYTAPTAGALQVAWLKLDHLPGLGGKPYLLRLRGSIAPTQMPILPPRVHLGATQGCPSAFQPLHLSNRSKRTIVLRRLVLVSSPHRDFVIRSVTLPYELPPQSETTIAWLQFTPTAKYLRAFEQLRVEFSSAGVSLAPQIVSLEASSGFPMYETFTQAKAKHAQVFFYVDPKTELSEPMISTFTTLLLALQAHQIEYQILPLTLTAQPRHHPNSPEEVRHLLISSQRTEQVHGLEAMRLTLKRNQGFGVSEPATRAVIFISNHDDLSGHGVQRYLPTSSDAPFAIFSAVPGASCQSFAEAVRYRSAAMLSQGAYLDLCSADRRAWERWAARIRRFVIGQRKIFPFSHKPKTTSIQVQIDRQVVSSRDWSYDDANHQLTLSSDRPLHLGSRLRLSYHTMCKSP